MARSKYEQSLSVDSSDRGLKIRGESAWAVEYMDNMSAMSVLIWL